jgi:hypothetical protein
VPRPGTRGKSASICAWVHPTKLRRSKSDRTSSASSRDASRTRSQSMTHAFPWYVRKLFSHCFFQSARSVASVSSSSSPLSTSLSSGTVDSDAAEGFEDGRGSFVLLDLAFDFLFLAIFVFVEIRVTRGFRDCRTKDAPNPDLILRDVRFSTIYGTRKNGLFTAPSLFLNRFLLVAPFVRTGATAHRPPPF